MMSVLEYANDIGKDVGFVLGLCSRLGIEASSDNDMLSDDDIILLDNETMNKEYDDISDAGVELDILDSYEDELEEVDTGATFKNNHKSNMNSDFKGTGKSSQKGNSNRNNQKRNVQKKKENFQKQRKEMYKHKEKLKSNREENMEKFLLFEEGNTVSDIASYLKVTPADIIKKLMMMGKMVNINTSIDFDTAEIIALEYGLDIKRKESMDETHFEDLVIIDNEDDLVERPPVVTIMGHVDHGKTTLLDAIRKTNVAEGEAGGITQATYAYQITHNDKKITFIDTPGHAAFTEMRARGASITDIIIIIVAADDGVMPQTVEVIDHAKAANVPIIVAINKIDKPSANPDKVMQEISNYGLIPEEWGGDVMVSKISAKTGEGIDDLLERILLISELEGLKANPNRYASGTVIEAKMDKSLGNVSAVLIQNGTLRLGDYLVVGNYYGKIRSLKNDKGENLTFATPSMPVWITGISEIPSAGDKFMAFESEKRAKSISEERILNAKNLNNTRRGAVSLDDLFGRISQGERDINIILKSDVKGSEEAVKNSLLKLDVEGIHINIIRSGIGTVTESDVVLASASDAIIIGFNVRPGSKIMEYAKEKGVDIRLYNIIYKLLEEVESAMKGKLEPVFEERVVGEAVVRKLFKFSKVGTIAGCYVTSGSIKRGAKVRLIRDGIVVYDGSINSLAREKDQVKEVKNGFECGITIENFNDIKENDVMEVYEEVEIKR